MPYKGRQLNDDSLMPFGKHKGLKLSEVPASYLFYLWTNGLETDYTSDIADYIRRNWDAFCKESNKFADYIK